jgi:16S rRNA (guanine527-N7)-methyltransferase
VRPSYAADFPSVPNSAWSQLEGFQHLLIESAIPQGLVGFAPDAIPGEIARSLLLLQEIGPGTLIDIGSGAGLPGVPLAFARTDSGPVYLLDRKERACRFLERVVRELQVSAEVACVSAEEAAKGHLSEAGDCIVGRAVAPLPGAVELAAPLTRVGGRILLTTYEGEVPFLDPSSREELGIGEPTRRKLNAGIDLVQHVLIIDKLQPTSPTLHLHKNRRKKSKKV